MGWGGDCFSIHSLVIFSLSICQSSVGTMYCRNIVQQPRGNQVFRYSIACYYLSQINCTCSLERTI